MSTTMMASSLPLSFFTSTAMPVSSAPVSVIMPRNPPRIITNRHTGSASAKPLTGAVKKSLNLAALTSPGAKPDTTTVTMATMASNRRRMVNDESMPRFFLVVSAIELIPLSQRETRSARTARRAVLVFRTGARMTTGHPEGDAGRGRAGPAPAPLRA